MEQIRVGHWVLKCLNLKLSDLSKYLNKEFGIVLDDESIAHKLWADDLVLIADRPTGLQRQLDGRFEFSSWVMAPDDCQQDYDKGSGIWQCFLDPI